MARFSMNEMTTYRWSFEEDVARYVEAGIEAIGVWRQKLSDFGEFKGVDLLAESGLAVSNLLWAGGFTGSDGRTYREAVDDAEEAISLAASMQAGCLIVYSGARNGHTHNHARRLICTALKELAVVADDMEVTLAVEPMHAGCAEQWTFLTDLDDTLELLKEVGSRRVKLALDTYHMGHDRAIFDRLPELVDDIAININRNFVYWPEGVFHRSDCRYFFFTVFFFEATFLRLLFFAAARFVGFFAAVVLVPGLDF